jgi:DNA-binding transcriptional regulator LsrR (DeoR family)
MVLDQELHRLLYQIAKAYYEDDQTQREIAKSFGLSRPKVSRLLKLAREEGIVNISFVPPSGGLTDLEREVKQKYGLEEVVAVQVRDSRNPGAVARELGPPAAEVLIRRITGNEVLAVAWGTTLMSLVDALPYKSVPLPYMTVVQMTGGLGPVDQLEHSSELARRMAQKFNARFRLMSAPGVVADKKAAKILHSVKQITEVLDLAASAQIAVVSMGVLSSHSMLVRDGTILTKEDIRAIQKAGAVGDIALHFVNEKGQLLDLEINEKIIGLTNSQLKRIPLVIAVAGGDEKYDVIRAGLYSKIPRILVTDHVTAQRLVKEKT